MLYLIPKFQRLLFLCRLYQKTADLLGFHDMSCHLDNLFVNLYLFIYYLFIFVLSHLKFAVPAQDTLQQAACSERFFFKKKKKKKAKCLFIATPSWSL